MLVNVADVDKARVGDDEPVAAAVAERRDRARRRRAGCCCGQSGTEPLVRVMVEADEAGRAGRWPSGWPAWSRERLALQPH